MVSTYCWRLLMMASALLCAVEGARAQEGLAQCATIIPRDHHAWGRFGAGSWKLVRVVTETFDEQGRMLDSSTTETRSTLESADDWGYSLRIESTVEVAGKRFTVKPQVVSKGYNGEQAGQTVEIRHVGAGTVEIDGQRYASEICELVVVGRTTKRITTVHYNERFAPFILRQETKVAEGETARPEDSTRPGRTTESFVNVIALDMPHKVLAETKSVAEVKTVMRYPTGEATILELHCQEVPGGVVQHSSKETDADGRVVRRSTLELLDYHAVPREPAPPTRRPGLFRRIRNR